MIRLTLMPGDGIGPEVCQAAVKVLEALQTPISWDVQPIGLSALASEGALLPDAALKSFEATGIALKGPTTTPVGSGHSSINVLLRKKFDLYTNMRPISSIAGIKTPFSDRAIDLVIFRENTEDLYAGVEQQITPDEVHAIKIITRKASSRIALAAFDYAKRHGKKKVTVVHKANIMKQADGLFLEAARAVASTFPDVSLEEVIVDNMCLQLVTQPEQFEVILTENLYGDILSDLCAGLVGGLGIAPGANIGQKQAIFEAVHGSAPDIAGQNKANPTAMMLSAAMLLDYLGEFERAYRLRAAIAFVLNEGRWLTADLGGSATTLTMTEAVIRQILSLHTTQTEVPYESLLL